MKDSTDGRHDIEILKASHRFERVTGLTVVSFKVQSDGAGHRIG